MNLYQQYISYGLSVIPCKNKKPLIEWKQYQDKIAVDVSGWEGEQIACICGAVSGGLVCIDFDIKNGNKYNDWLMLIQQQAPELLSKMVIESTPSGGWHVVFRTNKQIKNIKLAMNKDGFCTIETRGEGGYFVCAPSPNYAIDYGGFDRIQKLTMDETELILSAAMSLNEKTLENTNQEIHTKYINGGISPFDDYDLRETPINLLLSHGWKYLFKRGTAVFIQRPKKEGRGISATWNSIPNRFYCFSTSTSFENNHVYKASAVYAILEHGGNYSAAAKKLQTLGYGKKDAQPLLKQSQQIKTKTIDKRDVRSRIYDIIEHGYIKGKSTGWKSLDKLYSIVKGQFTVINGVPSSGKSEFIDAIAVNLMLSDGWNYVYFSPENYPVEMHCHKLIEKINNKELRKCTRQEVDSAMDKIDKHFYFIDALEDDVTLEMILEETEKIMSKNKIDALIVDPWNEIELSRPGNVSESDYIGKCLRTMRKFARRNKIHLFIVAHPTKLQRGKDGKYPVPEMWDLSGSANWRNKADNGLCVNRNFDAGYTTIIVQKIKYKYAGKPGEAILKYNIESGRYYEDDSCEEHYSNAF